MEDMFIGLGKNNIRIKDGEFTTNMKLGQLSQFFKVLTDGRKQTDWEFDYYRLKELAEEHIRAKNAL